MKTTSLLAPVLLVLIATSCASAPSGGQSGAAPAGGEKKNGEDAKELQAKLDKATLKLEIARIDAKNGEAASARSVETATLEAELASGALENFRGVLQPIEAASSVLSLDRGRQRVKESKEELEELEKMYAQEQFADLTKELVLTRGRSALEMAQRDYDLAEKRAAQARDFEWPRKERELTEKVAATQRALDDARARAEKGQIERKLALMEAEEAVTKAREALEKAQPAG